MATIKDINGYFDYIAPKELSEEWDNDNIMFCCDSEKQINKIVVALEVNMEVVRFAVESGADLIVTHHPFIFRPLKRICGLIGDIVSLLAKNSISVLSYHTRLDSADRGVNTVLAQSLGLSEIERLGDTLGRKGRIQKMTIQAFAVRVKNFLGCPNLRYCTADDDKEIEYVAVVGGAGKDFISDAKEAGCDCLLTADVSHNAFIDACNMDICLIDAGHYYTENVIVEYVANMLNEQFPDTDVFTFDVGSPYKDLVK